MPTVSEIITQFTISCRGKKCCYCVSDLLSIKFLSFVICSIVNQQEFQLAKLLVFKLKKGLIFYKNHYIWCFLHLFLEKAPTVVKFYILSIMRLSDFSSQKCFELDEHFDMIFKNVFEKSIMFQKVVIVFPYKNWSGIGIQCMLEYTRDSKLVSNSDLNASCFAAKLQLLWCIQRKIFENFTAFFGSQSWIWNSATNDKLM